MTMAQYFHDNPGEKHGEIQFLLPDRRGDRLPRREDARQKPLQPEIAYTLDGGPLGEITLRDHSTPLRRASTVTGVNIHPGLSKNQMINAILIANEFINMLPPAETPSAHRGLRGLLPRARGERRGRARDAAAAACATTTLRSSRRRKQRLRDIAEFLNKVYGEGRVTVEIEDTYRNIGEAIKPCFEIVEAIEAAMKARASAPFYTPMRAAPTAR